MSRDCENGDNLTLCAFSNFYNCDVFVYSPMVSQPILIQPQLAQINNQTFNLSASIGPKRDAVYVAMMGGDYYQALGKNPEQPLLGTWTMLSVDEELKSLVKLHIEDKETKNSVNPLSPLKRVQETEYQGGLQQAEGSTQQQKALKTSLSGGKYFRSVGIKALTDMCIEVVCRYIEYVPPLEGSLPEELVQKVISVLIEENKLSAVILERTLDVSITSLNLDRFKHISSQTCTFIAQVCTSLRKLSLANSVGLTPEDLIAIVSSCQRYFVATKKLSSF